MKLLNPLAAPEIPASFPASLSILSKFNPVWAPIASTNLEPTPIAIAIGFPDCIAASEMPPLTWFWSCAWLSLGSVLAWVKASIALPADWAIPIYLDQSFLLFVWPPDE